MADNTTFSLYSLSVPALTDHFLFNDDPGSRSTTPHERKTPTKSDDAPNQLNTLLSIVSLPLINHEKQPVHGSKRLPS